MRFSIDDYSKRFKMSKEMIHSRMRNKRLNYIIEDGVTYIIVPRSSLDSETRRELHDEQMKEREETAQTSETQDEEQPTVVAAPRQKKTTVGTIIALYQKENHQLKQRIKTLEAKIDKLIDDKERMLIAERNRIEQVYNNKDEQLKTILELINTKLLSASVHESTTVHDVNIAHEHEKHDESPTESLQPKYIELKSYLKTLEIPSNARKIIKRRFSNAYGSDVRIIQQNGEFYLDFSKYDYSDLLSH